MDISQDFNFELINPCEAGPSDVVKEIMSTKTRKSVRNNCVSYVQLCQIDPQIHSTIMQLGLVLLWI